MNPLPIDRPAGQQLTPPVFAAALENIAVALAGEAHLTGPEKQLLIDTRVPLLYNAGRLSFFVIAKDAGLEPSQLWIEPVAGRGSTFVNTSTLRLPR